MDLFGIKRKAQERYAEDEAALMVAEAERRIPRLNSIANKSSDWKGWAEIEKHKRVLER